MRVLNLQLLQKLKAASLGGAKRTIIAYRAYGGLVFLAALLWLWTTETLYSRVFVLRNRTELLTYFLIKRLSV